MARLNLSTRADRWWPRLSGRDLSNLPEGLSQQLDLLVRQMGISREKFVAYSPSTRVKYIRAAKKGRTVSEERQRVKAQRRARETRKKGIARTAEMMRKVDRIQELRHQLIYDYGMDTTRDENTHVDIIAARVLLSQESINEHVARYGYDYVLHRLESMVAAIDAAGVGEQAWADFTNTTEKQDEDERWFWYHSQPTAVIFSR